MATSSAARRLPTPSTTRVPALPRVRPGNWFVVVKLLGAQRLLTFGFADAGDAGQALAQIKPRFPTARLARLNAIGD